MSGNTRIALAITLLSLPAAGLAVSQNRESSSPPPTTIGLSTVQMYSTGQPAGRGPLVVVEVFEGTAAASSGVRAGDLVLAIDGTPVMGKDPAEAFHDQLHGPAGGTVRLTLARPAEGMRTVEAVLTRVPTPRRPNPAFEPFGYSAPRAWRLESYTFPLPWAPKLAYKGQEDILFAPQFADRSSSEYHSLAWVWWVEGGPAVTADSLRSTLLDYFRGLSEERGASHDFLPQADRVVVTAMVPAAGKEPPPPAGVRAFHGDVTTYDTEGSLITLHVDVEERPCPDGAQTALLFALSPAPHEAAVWNDLFSIRSSFRCRRGER